MIAPNGNPAQECTKAVTATRNVTLLTVGGPGIIWRSGCGRVGLCCDRASSRENSADYAGVSQDDICFVVPSADAGRTIEALRRTFLVGVRPVELDHIQVNDNVAIVAVVGDKMRGTPGIAGRLFSRLGREGVNIIAIAQGSSENNISFLVEARQMKRAVAAIHDEFHLARSAAGVAAEQQARRPPHPQARPKLSRDGARKDDRSVATRGRFHARCGEQVDRLREGGAVPTGRQAALHRRRMPRDVFAR